MLHLKKRSLNWALKHALKFGDTDVFPPTFEYQALKHDWKNVLAALMKEDVDLWKTRPLRSLLAPKARYGFRIITQLDPLDYLLFSALVFEVGRDLERERLPVSAGVVFSHRFSPKGDGRMYSPEVGYAEFLSRAREILSERKYTHVAVTDIADFYPRIYHHRLENALAACTKKSDHVRAIKKLLSGWNETESHGIPVGGAPARLLAEITIHDVDEALTAHRVRYIRFNDDFRIFASSHAEAFQHLALLAQVLYDNHGLTLQPQKTSILPASEFANVFLSSAEDKELDELHSQFRDVLEAIGLTDRYEVIEYDDLDEEQQRLIDSLNLKELFTKEIQKNTEPDLTILRFILRRMAQLGDESLADEAMDNLEVIYPAFADVIQYLQSLRHLQPRAREKLGERLLHQLDHSMISELPYYRMWTLSVFTHSEEWDNAEKFQSLLNENRDAFTRRELILAMGRANQSHWFQSQWRRLFDEPPWTRRSLLAAASCLNGDARDHWYRSVSPRLDLLEKAIVKWAKAHPFG